MVKKIIKQIPPRHRILLSVASVFLLIAFIIPSENASASRQVGKRYDIAPLAMLSEETAAKTGLAEIDGTTAQKQGQDPEVAGLQWQHFSVKKGDNLARIFKRAGLSPQQTYKISKVKNAGEKLKKVMPGDTLSLLIGKTQELLALRYSMSATHTLHINQDVKGNYVAKTETKAVDIRLDYTQGEISSNFWNAGVIAGLNDNQIMSLADIFGWDIDFALGIRKGDNFNVIYEKKYIDGEYAGVGNIVAAEFVNRGTSYQAIRYEDGQYYTPEGRSLRKSFLRNPVNFKYISSNFTNRRFHPVQKRWKVHRGVDYAAKTGTPVVAAGNGKVIKSGFNRFNGHYVFIQHGEKYVTKYLHFSKRKVKRGQTVKQGQVIGLVGSTGMASGPHLHYEFLVNGVHHNPRTVKLPKALPIAKKERQKFKQLAKLRVEQLQTHKRIMLAKN